MKEYTISAASQTANEGKLEINFVLEVYRVDIKKDIFRVYVNTCSATGKPAMKENQKDFPVGYKAYPYVPATDNAKSISTLLTDNFEPELDIAFPGNWS